MNGRARSNALITAVLVVLAAASFGITVAVRRNATSSTTEPPAPTSATTTAPGSTRTTTSGPASSTTTSAATTSTTPGPTTTTTTTSIVVVTAATTAVADTVVLPPDAITQLDTEVDADRAVAESLVGFWVTQLSSKKPGLVVGGVTLTADDVLATHRQLDALYGTVLLSSSEYNYQVTDLYVDVVPVVFDDPDSALQFCFDEGIGRDDCFAKFITHDMSIEHTTKLQPKP